MANITANDLKTRGVGAIESALAEDTEVFVSVRGRPRFVILDVEEWQKLRERELEAAVAEARADYAAGKFTRSSAEEHLARLDANE